MIETKRLRIRYLEDYDYLDMYEYMSKADVLKYEQMSPFTLESLKQFTCDISKSKRFYAIILKKTNKLIGHLFFGQSHPKEFNEYTLGYIVNPNYQNEGYCTEAAGAIMNYGFNTLNIHRIAAFCNPENVPSWKVMEKLNMRKEGLHKKRVCFKYEKDGTPIYWDELVHAILAEEWNYQEQP